MHTFKQKKVRKALKNKNICILHGVRVHNHFSFLTNFQSSEKIQKHSFVKDKCI